MRDAACLLETLRPGRVRLPVALTHGSHGDSSDAVLGKHGLPREPSKHVMTPPRGETSSGTNTRVNDGAAGKTGRRGAVVIDDSCFPAATSRLNQSVLRWLFSLGLLPYSAKSGTRSVTHAHPTALPWTHPSTRGKSMLISSTNRSRPAVCERRGDGATALLTNSRVRVSFSVLIYGNEACPPSDPYLSARGSRRATGRPEHLIYIFLIYTSSGPRRS